VNLNSIMIGSEDPKALGAYYTKLFGKPVFEDSGYQGWQLGTGFLTVGGHDQVKGGNDQPGRLMFCLETPDVQAQYQTLVKAGAISVQEPYHPSEADEMWVATLADPDDNYFQLMSPFEGPK
jgi:predicted enzyme related to lactoylglutathione lyase